jgi:hypothetical protein
MITTKGDANTDADTAFDKSNILGKVVYQSELLNFVVRNRIFIIIFVILIYLLEIVIKSMINKEDSEELNA